jgi:type VII secretion integral membrane protein EccD
MAAVSTGAVALVRVTVTSATRRVDLALPGAVPVAELVPELAQRLGLLDSQTVLGGYHLVTHDGLALTTETGLSAQGVTDGAFLSLAVDAPDSSTQVYDDLAEAMADAVGRDLVPWRAASARRTALWAATLLVLAGIGILLIRHGPRGGAPGSVGVAVLLVVVAVVHARRHREIEAAVTIALTACAVAAVAGLLLGSGATAPGTPVAAAGGGMLTAAGLAALGLVEGRILLLPPAVVGAVLLSTGLAARVAPADPATVVTVVLVLVVLTGSAFPRLALATTGTSCDPLFTLADITRDPEQIEGAAVRADARLAHQIVVAMSATSGVLLVLVAPVAVSLGLAGTVVALLLCVVVLLRTRQHSSAPDVLVGLVPGLLGLVSTAVSAAWLHPAWQSAAALALVTSGVLVLATTQRVRGRSLRDGRLGDALESAALLAISPTLVFASGLFSWVQSQVAR